MGAQPTPIDFPELYSALQQGVVDGAENNVGALTADLISQIDALADSSTIGMRRMAHKEHDPVGDGHEILHNEAFEAPFRSVIIGQDNWLFTSGRPAHSLNGEWAFTLDLHFNGLRSRWYEMTPMAPEQRVFPYDWDPFNADTTPVPSNWQMQDDKAYLFEGAA